MKSISLQKVNQQIRNMPTEKQNEGEEKCENQPAARQNQNKDTNISMGI